MHADYVLASTIRADAERRAAERSRRGHPRRRRRYRLTGLARWIAATARRLDPLPPLEAGSGRSVADEPRDVPTTATSAPLVLRDAFRTTPETSPTGRDTPEQRGA